MDKFANFFFKAVYYIFGPTMLVCCVLGFINFGIISNLCNESGKLLKEKNYSNITLLFTCTFSSLVITTMFGCIKTAEELALMLQD